VDRPSCSLLLAVDPVMVPVTVDVELFDTDTDADDEVVDGRLNVTCLVAFLPATT